jgi:hypothetical protein
MKRHLGVLLYSLAAAAALPLAGPAIAQPHPGGACEVVIDTPREGDKVTAFTPVVGRLSARAAAIAHGTVWIVIHPDGDFFWVQRPASASSPSWQASTRFGAGATPPGFHFEFQAVVAPTAPMREGDTLAAFPTGACASRVVSVYR